MDVRQANLVVRFILELVVLVALAIWGFNATSELLVRIVLGLGAPAIVIGVWAGFVAPKASRRLDDPARLVIEILVFAAGVAAFWQGGLPILALLLAVAAIVSLGLMFAWGQRGL